MQIKFTDVNHRINSLVFMRIYMFLFCASLFGISPITSQNSIITIEKDQMISVDDLFDLIKSQTDYAFVYEEGLFKNFPKTFINKGNIGVKELLNTVMKRGNVDFEFKKNLIHIYNSLDNSSIYLQKLTIQGIVTDISGIPIPGASVQIKGTKKIVVCDFDGRYRITVSNLKAVLIFSSLAFKSKEIKVEGQQEINVTLEEDIEELQAVYINHNYYNTSREEETGNVSRISAKAIEKQPVSNPLAAMQGNLPGVNITQNTGTPGGDFNIQIRGKNFIDGSTEPLYVVDGVPFSSDPLANFNDTLAELFPEGKISPLNLIAPSNIASIEVLKDADATAIYGTKGANGVVLITTKKGTSGKLQIKANFSTGMAHVSNFVELLNTEEYLTMRREALVNDGVTLETIPGIYEAGAIDLLEWDQTRYTDWQDVLIGNTAYRYTGDMSFSGGTKQTRFLFGANYHKETTVYIGDSRYKKGVVYSNISHESENQRFSANLNINYSRDDNQLPGIGFTEIVYELPPNAPELYDNDGNLTWEDWSSVFKNPLAQLQSQYRSKLSNFQINSSLSYQLIKDLELKTNIGYTDYHNVSYRTTPNTLFPPFTITGSSSDFSRISFNIGDRQSWILEPQIGLKKDYRRFHLEALLGASFQKESSNQKIISALGFSSNNQILDLSAAQSIRILKDEDLDYHYQAVFGRINFKWAGRYILNLTGRRDGSSRFGPGRQFGNFYALGGAWLFSKEKALEHSTVISFGKLRGSYGTTGSDNVPDYAFYDTYNSNTINYNGSGLQTTRLFNPIFAWQVNKKFEVGLELGFFDDHIMLSTSWYQNRSSNQLVDIPLSDTTGFPSVNGNLNATVENTGLEIDLNMINIQNSHFTWTTRFNISVPRNKLVRFDNLESSTYRDMYVVGEPLSIRKLYHVTSVNPDTGIYEFEDYNNDGEINYTFDRGFIQDLSPRFYGGLGNNFTYDNWSLDIQFQFKKHIISDFVSRSGVLGFASNVPKRIVGQQWQEFGDEAVLQRYTIGLNADAVTAGRLYQDSNAIYNDGSFIRLRNIALNYQLPNEFVPGLNASIYLQGQNLLTFTKFKGPDPDHFSNRYLPALRQLIFGIQLGF